MSMVSVGVYLRTLRNATRLSQGAAAQKAGLVAKTVERWEAGDNEPAISTLRPYLAVIRGSVLRVLTLLAADVSDEDARRYAEIDRQQADLIAKEAELTEQLLSLTGERRQAAILMLEQLLAAESAELTKTPAFGGLRAKPQSE